MTIDGYLFSLINGFAKKSRALDFFAIFCAKYLGYLLLAGLVLAAVAAGTWRFFVIPVFAGCISLLVVNELIYVFYKRRRPVELVPDAMIIEKPMSPAFPSSHTSFFFAISLTLLLFSVPLAVLFLALSSLISISRIFCGVHWPSDIVGGVCSAIISFLVIYFIKAIALLA